MSKKLMLMASPAVLVATSLTGAVAPIVHAEEVGEDVTVDLYKAELVDGVWVKSGEVIDGYDFSKYEAPLREAGDANGMELVDARIKAVDMESGEEIDFGSLSDFKKDSEKKFKSGSNYQFQLQGVFMLIGEGADDSLVETDFVETDYVIVAETPQGTTEPTDPPVDPEEPEVDPDIPWTPIEPSTPVEPPVTDPDEDVEVPWTPIEPSTPVDPDTGDGEGDGDVEVPWTPIEPSTPVDPDTGGGEGDGDVDVPWTPIEPSTPVEPPVTDPDEDVDVPWTPIEPSTPVDPDTGNGGDGTGGGTDVGNGDGNGTGNGGGTDVGNGDGTGSDGEVTPPTEKPDKPSKPVEVKPGDKETVIDNDDVGANVGVTDPDRETDDVTIEIEVKPGTPIEEGTIIVIEKDKDNGDTEIVNKPIGSVDKDTVVKEEITVDGSTDKDYELIIKDKDEIVGNGDFHVSAVEKFRYVDVKKGNWAYDDIYGATDLKIVKGYHVNGLNYFKPGVEVTRAQAVVMVLRSLGVDYTGYKGEGFTDAKGTWYESAIAKAKDLGIAEGYTDGTFKGNDTLSREHLAVFLNRSFIDGFDSKGANFTDVNKKHWASPAIDAMTDIGIIEGYKDGTYKPKENTTRAQIVAMINRTLTVDSEYVNVNKYKNSTVAKDTKGSGLGYSVVEGEGTPQQTVNADDAKSIITVK